MSTQETINKVRAEHANLVTKTINSLTAVIVSTEYRKGKFNNGVQFWSAEQIAAGVSKNTDNTSSKFLAYL